MSFVSRRQFLLGASAAATLSITPALLKEEPQAQALQPIKKKYNYSLNPRTNQHRFGILSLPHHSLSPSVPVAVLVHGGSWTTNGDVYSVRHLSNELSHNGVAVWNIEYRSLGTGGGWPTTYADVCDAIDHLLVLKVFHAINLDLNRIYLVGHSAGSQLAALALGQSSRSVSLSKLVGNTEFFRNGGKEVAFKNLRGDNIVGSAISSHLPIHDNHPTTVNPANAPHYDVVGTGNMANQRTKAPAGPSLPIRGLISLNGVLDVVDSANRSQSSSIATFLGGTPTQVPGNYYAANPFTHLPTGKKIAILQGDQDTIIPPGQGLKYVAAARRRGNRAYYHWVRNVQHNDFLYPHRNSDAFNFGVRTVLHTMGMPYKPWANKRRK